jgi:hypothetical protein
MNNLASLADWRGRHDNVTIVLTSQLVESSAYSMNISRNTANTLDMVVPLNEPN